jgi:hypothetical protein
MAYERYGPREYKLSEGRLIVIPLSELPTPGKVIVSSGMQSIDKKFGVVINVSQGSKYELGNIILVRNWAGLTINETDDELYQKLKIEGIEAETHVVNIPEADILAIIGKINF